MVCSLPIKVYSLRLVHNICRNCILEWRNLLLPMLQALPMSLLVLVSLYFDLRRETRPFCTVAAQWEFDTFQYYLCAFSGVYISWLPPIVLIYVAIVVCYCTFLEFVFF